MARWEPDARGRLQRAALELYAERGYDRTTTASIAERAGLNERTFFRHYADKREVLFGGSGALQDLMVETVVAAAQDVPPLEAVITAIEAADVLFTPRRALVRQRQAVITAHPELGERELAKLAALSGALAGALRDRGVSASAADLAAEVGMAVFRLAFKQWVDQDEQDFPRLVRHALRELEDVVPVERPPVLP